MEIRPHECYHKRFDSYIKQLKPTPLDRPYLKHLLEPYEALTLDDTRSPQ